MFMSSWTLIFSSVETLRVGFTKVEEQALFEACVYEISTNEYWWETNWSRSLIDETCNAD